VLPGSFGLTRVPRSWNSGIPTNCTPVYGTGCTVGFFGVAFVIDWSVSGPKDFEIASYSGRSV